MRSINICSRARTSKDQRGFVLITALTLSILYFALMELLLVDSSRSLNEAQRFRSHVVAQALAENAAELAALDMINRSNTVVNTNDDQGSMKGNLQRLSNTFIIEGEGEAIGAMKQTSRVRVQGRIESSGTIKIDFAFHND